MLDIKFVRENINTVKEALEKRGDSFDLVELLRLDERRRELIKKIDELRAGVNSLNNEITSLLKGKKDPKEIIDKSKKLSAELEVLENDNKSLKEEFYKRIIRIPNIPHVSVPRGGMEENKVVKERGDIKKFDFNPLTHVELGEDLDIIDFKRSAKISGANFILLKGAGAELERALINMMLDLHSVKHGYKEVSPPFLVNSGAMITTGQLPNLEDDMYKVDGGDLFLIPTAEVPVTNIHANEMIDEESLPIYYSAYTACFRREAGSYGKETKGLTRVHQFNKVELVKIVKEEFSYDELEKLLMDACEVLDMLDLPYRVVMLASGDLSFASAKCYDIEVYSPGLDKWLEVSSCSNFEDFQARRGNIRYRDKKAGRVKFAHTLNGSGLALPRLLIALMENYQNRDKSITIPPSLRRYFNERERIAK